ncbi:ArsR/SmtB family transcription factor [Promicromonospora soli]|uniref:Transcriptional regulator n=1 Tax=Promicromonospora soli TaxID=2035533 RepID=A0A919KU46_9MICO|nr:helix-turn-helix domain-containing protein [Promicromonospora soli]GHH72729.1 transcriptional regulator [Promicromonospora soli]
MTGDDVFRINDPETLKAVAHPLRQRIVLEIAVREHARAADLAKALGEPANSVSFHLRVLARAGLIEEAPELARDKRDRVWKRVIQQFTVDPGLADAGALFEPYLRWMRAMFLRDRAAPGKRHDYNTGVAHDGFFTREEAREMADEVKSVLDRWSDLTIERKRAAPDDPDRKYYQILFAVGPRDLAAEAAPED